MIDKRTGTEIIPRVTLHDGIVTGLGPVFTDTHYRLKKNWVRNLVPVSHWGWELYYTEYGMENPLCKSAEVFLTLEEAIADCQRCLDNIYPGYYTIADHTKEAP